MPDDERGDEDEDLHYLIGCDRCGKVMESALFDGNDPLLTVVTDPAAVHPEAPVRNGLQMVMVCSPACYDAIRQRFQPPPPDEQ
ncbi:hypothetical protein ADK70_04740 [Streptomyces rimosus subsp. pseudoverticillatus]|uniref:hypothetical protein n=1 Tax=Streptomyces rimosus TaxID=1927 RepID=UPI0006B29140|nr:hypothetical protein [Streptomyces rimosus]KOT99150.1 hypothetical protein ADK70_04740 [Streptomyces rimosus subsp. pseudoverticillatus]